MSPEEDLQVATAPWENPWNRKRIVESRDVSNVRAYVGNTYEARFVVRATILPVRAPVHVRTPGGGGLRRAQIIRANYKGPSFKGGSS